MLQHIVYVYFHWTYKYIYIQGMDIYVQVIVFDKNNSFIEHFNFYKRKLFSVFYIYHFIELSQESYED